MTDWKVESMLSWSDSAKNELRQVEEFKYSGLITEWSDNYVYLCARHAVHLAMILLSE